MRGPTGVSSFPRPEAEAYVTRAELARQMGVSAKTVDRLRAQGMPSVVWGGSARRFLPSEALRWARQRQLDREAA